MKRILVIGSTGMLGKPVTLALINAPFEVTVFVRDISKAEKIFNNKKIKFITGSLEDKNALRKAVKNQEGIYLSLLCSSRRKKRGFSH